MWPVSVLKAAEHLSITPKQLLDTFVMLPTVCGENMQHIVFKQRVLLSDNLELRKENHKMLNLVP